jgi:regulatory protein
MAEGKDPSQKKEMAIRARKKMMDLLARRDHSERELRKKLKEKIDDSESIEAALEYGKEQGWIPEDEDSRTRLAERMAEMLHKKLKGIHYINHYLAEKGLPELPADESRELEKARQLIETKFSNDDEWDSQMSAKAGRFLASRGFEMSVIRQVVFKR